MIQAFVSLKPQQPSRTESGMRSFFEALQGAVFSQPTIFRTNADASIRPYSLDAVCEAALNPGCKFVVLRAECEKFWQCTFLLPDKQGMGALFFDLQRQENPRRLSPDSLIEMFKKLYLSLQPRLIRIGDSEAREKLKSRHGLVMMPGLGRIEWLQIVSREVYGDIYNSSELIASPGFSTEVWEDGALFMRVYDDPNDWDLEDNISRANFVPGFLAGIAKISDSEKQKETLRDLEKIWTRAEKTAEKAYEVLDADPNAKKDTGVKVKEEKQVVDETPLVSEAAAEEGDDAKLAIVKKRLEADYKITDIVKAGQEGICTLFKVKAERRPVFYATYQDIDRKVFILTDIEDLGRFLAINDCAIKPECFDKIKSLTKKYYHPDYQLLDSLDELPDTVIRDRRMPDMRAEFKPAAVENIDGTLSLTFWFYKPELLGLETITFTQMDGWPMQLNAKVQCTDMENEPEVKPDPVQEVKAEPAKVEEPAKAEEPAKEDEKASEGESPVFNLVDDNKPKAKRKSAQAEEEDEVPEKADDKGGLSTGAKAGIAAVFIIILIAIVLYALGVFGGGQADNSSVPSEPSNAAEQPAE